MLPSEKSIFTPEWAAACLVAGGIVVASALLTWWLDPDEGDPDQIQYCQMVAAGLWPDYDHAYQAECPKLGFPAKPAAYEATQGLIRRD